MNEKFNKNAKVEQLTKMFLTVRKKKALSLKILLSADPAGWWLLAGDSFFAVWSESDGRIGNYCMLISDP